jgi:hypothetical protein
MFKGRLTRWGLTAALVLLAGALVAWMLAPPDIESRVRPGMTWDEVDAALATRPGTRALVFYGAPSATHAWCFPDGMLAVTFSDGRVSSSRFEPAPFMDRLRDWLGW